MGTLCPLAWSKSPSKSPSSPLLGTRRLPSQGRERLRPQHVSPGASSPQKLSPAFREKAASARTQFPQ